LDDSHLRAVLDKEQAEAERLTRDIQCEKLAIEHERRKLSVETERVNGVRRAAVAELEAQKGNWTAVEKQYNRVAALIKSGIAAQSEMDQITGERDKSAAWVKASLGTVDAAESHYQRAMTELEGLRVREVHLGVLEAQLREAEAEVAEARANLDATVLRAPDDGRVLERIVEVGGSAKVGEPMISLWIGPAWVEAWADEKHLGRLKVGSRAEIALEAFPEKKLAGRVQSIGFVTDKQLQPAPVPATLHALVRQNAMVPVRITLEEEDTRVRLGLSAVVGIRKEADTAEAGRHWLVSRWFKDFSGR
jgi:membrane fusion protein (multidrug efflux system)